MTSSPDLIRELRAARPAAPVSLRARVREIAARDTVISRKPRPRITFRRLSLVALPTAAALALVSAGAVGLTRSGGNVEVGRDRAATDTAERAPELTQAQEHETLSSVPGALTPAIGPATGRIQQVSATLTVQVDGSDGVSRAAQEALDLTRRLGGHVVTASVATGEVGSAELTVRIPVAKVQEAIVGLSALGTIVSQQVRIDDLQESIDAFERRQRSLRSQIAIVVARLATGSLDAETRAKLEARLKNLRADLRGARRSESTLRAQGRMATIQLAVVTAESRGPASPPSRLDRTLDEALNLLVWEGVVALAIAIVAGPFALLAAVTWLGRRLHRRREEDRLLAA